MLFRSRRYGACTEFFSLLLPTSDCTLLPLSPGGCAAEQPPIIPNLAPCYAMAGIFLLRIRNSAASTTATRGLCYFKCAAVAFRAGFRGGDRLARTLGVTRSRGLSSFCPEAVLPQDELRMKCRLLFYILRIDYTIVTG